MQHRLLASLAAALLLAGCATTPKAPTASAGPVYEKGMVSAADPRAAEAGAQVLREGGSATDAALAMLLALNVVEPQSSGIGGGGFMLLADGTGTIETIDGRETAPKAATPQWFEVDGKVLTVAQAIPGGRSVGVPGNLSLMAQAHARHGKLAWKRLFDPAIALARDGFAISPRMRQYLDRSRSIAAMTAEGRALYFGADGEPLPVGTLVKNPALAAFLTRLANEGPKAFYTGTNAAAIAQVVATAPRNPAPMTTADLGAYRAKPRAPVCTTYRAYKVCGMGPPSSGATTVQGVLGMIERFDIGAMGKDSPQAWHLIAEAERLAYADRDRYLADADFLSVPVAGLVARDYLAQRSQLIALDRTIPAAEPGTPAGATTALADSLTPDVPSTSHFVAIDRNGQAVTNTSTIESSFGSGLMVNGYYLNNELTDFSLAPERDGKPVANRVEGGKRPRSSMAPTLVYGPDGKLRLAVGAAGGATIPVQVLRAIIGVIDWNLPVGDALALPVLFAPGGTQVFVEKGSALEAMIPALKALGHAEVIPRELPLKANAIEVIGGKLRGAADPRSEGAAISE
ncbi:gamma-glutamyltransferase [Novosphingobium sp. JCM 18896]|uniref:gamma-glutamyltransferase n=1 Tax=Novosphingobium sp. JCM 18896 TaxID=2989731 RepID=UPI00222256E3|nr:gamma-glutamyltransferase [Novosphingobium sp. JCM 18896]MCW1429228.1 gamma-glutamyltransferase [Novosphingobium sp. JCM 18896]